MTIADRVKSASVMKLYESFGLTHNMTMLASGTASDEHLTMNGLEATEKSVMYTTADGETVRQLVRAAKRKLFIDIPGNGIILSIPMKSIGGGKTLAYLTDNKTLSGGNPEMQFSHELIIVILNEGFSDSVMDFARAAGAGGGTVLHAKGTGSRSAEKFFGVSLATEKDVIYIVSPSKQKTAIMKAINENAGPGTKAGAICFSLPVSTVAGLRVIDDD